MYGPTDGSGLTVAELIAQAKEAGHELGMKFTNDSDASDDLEQYGIIDKNENGKADNGEMTEDGWAYGRSEMNPNEIAWITTQSLRDGDKKNDAEGEGWLSKLVAMGSDIVNELIDQNFAKMQELKGKEMGPEDIMAVTVSSAVVGMGINGIAKAIGEHTEGAKKLAQ